MDGYKISLAAARVNAKLTQAELAQRLAVNKTTIVNWESGKTSPKASQLKAYCEACRAPMDIIFLPDSLLKVEQ